MLNIIYVSVFFSEYLKADEPIVRKINDFELNPSGNTGHEYYNNTFVNKMA